MLTVIIAPCKTAVSCQLPFIQNSLHIQDWIHKALMPGQNPHQGQSQFTNAARIESTIPYATAYHHRYCGGSVQHGLSGTGGGLGFFRHGLAADNR